jgi:hypothetical protein
MTPKKKSPPNKEEALREIAETIFESLQKFSTKEMDRGLAAMENLLVKPGRKPGAKRLKRSPRRRKSR